MTLLFTPKVGTSDIDVKLTFVVEQGAWHNAGDIICELETSKTTFDMELEVNGYVYFLHDIDDIIPIGTPLAIVSETTIDAKDFHEKRKEISIQNKKTNNELESENVFSKKALILIQEYGLDRSMFTQEVVSEKDVLDYLKDLDSLCKVNSAKKFEKNDVIILGIGGHAAMCIDILLQDGQYNLVGFIDDSVKVDKRYNLEYLGRSENLSVFREQGLRNVILGIGFVNNLKKRSLLYKRLEESFFIPTIVHPKAIIEPSAVIGGGCQIMAGAIIGSNVTIEKNCIINSGAIVSHDCFIDRDSHITPGAVLAGNVKVGKRVTIGMAASIFIGLSISDDKVVLNGQAVFENV